MQSKTAGRMLLASQWCWNRHGGRLSVPLQAQAGGRWQIRTADLLGVNEAL